MHFPAVHYRSIFIRLSVVASQSRQIARNSDKIYVQFESADDIFSVKANKKAQLSLTNPRDAKACQKLLQFDVLTKLSLTILAYLHSFSCCYVRNLRNPAKFTKNSNLWSSRSSKVIDLGVNRKPMYDFLLVTNSNFGRICYRFRDIHG